MGTYMDIRFGIFCSLLILPQDDRQRLINKLIEEGAEEYEEFRQWVVETIKIGEEDLNQHFSEEFKSNFIQ